MHTHRSLAGIIVALTALSSVSPAFAVTYNNNTYEQNSYGLSGDALTYVKSRGLMTGYKNGSFGENNLVNRAEFAKVITLIYSPAAPSRYTTVLPFRDTANNAWYTPYIVYVYGNGLMTGYPDNTFHTDSPLTFAEAAKVLGIVYRLDTTDNSDLWYEGPVRALAGARAIPTSITSINQDLTRGQLADIVYRLDSGNRNQSSRTYDDLARTGGNFDNGNCGGNRTLQVTIEPQDTSVSTGDSIVYDITIENCNDNDERVDITADLDSTVQFDSASDAGYLNGSRTVQWNDLNVRSGDTQILTLRTRLLTAFNTNNNTVNLTVRATDRNGDTDSDSATVTVSGNSGGCFYNSNGQYICPNSNNSNNSCYYDSNNNYICNNNSTSNNCYYDSSNRYVCTNNNSSNNCYYNSNGQYICSNSNNTNNSNNCYYDSSNRYICTNTNSNNNCYYNSNGQYICNNSNNANSCYYDSNNNYICNNNCGNSCYYDNNGRYICSDTFSGTCTNSSGNQSITITPDTTQPQPDDVIRYTIRVRNNSGTSRSFTVRAQFSSDLTYVSSSNNVQITDNRNVYWNSVYVDSYQTVDLTLKLKVRSTAFDGQRLDLNVTADSGNGQSNNQTSTVYVRNPSTNTGCYYNSNGQYICNNSNNTNNCYYDSSNRYICTNNNSNSCYYNSYGQYICNNTGNIGLSTRLDTSSARVGDIVRSYMTLTNNQNRDEYIDLTANLDTNLTYVSASNSPASTNNGLIRWDRLFLRANATLTVTLDTRVGNFARVGDQLRINFTAAGSTNTATDSETINVRL